MLKQSVNLLWENTLNFLAFQPVHYVPAAATSLLQAPPSYQTVQAGIEDDSQASNVITTNTGKQE